MEINVTLLALFILMLLGIYWGYKRGFAKGVAGFIASISTIFMLGIFIRIYHAYTNGQTIDTVIATVILVVFGAIYGVIRLLLRSVKAIANLPIIAVIDKLLGIILGAVIVIAIFHLVFKASSLGLFGDIGYGIVTDVLDDEWLRWIARYDVIEMFVILKDQLLEKIGMLRVSDLSFSKR